MSDQDPRKKKVNLSDNAPPAANGQSDRTTASTAAADALKQVSIDSKSSQAAIAPQDSAQRPQATNRGSWAWRSKASPVAQVARESVSVEQGVNTESVTETRPGQSVSKSVRGSRKSVPLAAEATRVHATSNTVNAPTPLLTEKRVVDAKPSAAQEKDSPQQSTSSTKAVTSVKETKEVPQPSETNNSKVAEDQSAKDTEDKRMKVEDVRPQSGNWLNWWSRPDGYGSDGEKLQNDRATKKPRIDEAERQDTDLPVPDVPVQEQTHATEAIANPDGSSTNVKEMSVNPSANRSWFRLWSTAQNEQAAAEESNQSEEATRPGEAEATRSATVDSTRVAAEDTIPGQDQDLLKQKPQAGASEEARKKPAGWAFWSMDKAKTTAESSTPNEPQRQVGELAVADTPSQSHPEAAQFNEQRKNGKLVQGHDAKRKPAGQVQKQKAEVATSTEPPSTLVAATASAVAPALDSQPATAVLDTQTILDSSDTTLSQGQRGKRPQTQPNIISPSFRESFPPAPSIGYLERLTSYVAQTLLPGAEPPSPPVHPFISSTPHKVKKAIAIGVHGFFPAAVFQKVLGQPTGTSIRFANYAAASIKDWCQAHQPDVKDVQIEKVALEGEGNITDRVATLWKLLLNWLSHLRQADFILVAAHSQGVPVATMLVAKLLQLGALSPNVRIGLCAMAGINLGPFIEYKSRLFGSTALELFDFCDSNSKVSIRYAEAVDTCLRHNVRITYVSSLDDQLVSVESSLHAPLSHPYVNRAVFIDGRLHTSNFLTHLVIFSVKLRNRGISDHGLLREVSAPLAGSLVGGEGHSRVYDDAAVYTCAVEFALESTDMPVPSQANAVVREAVGEEERGKMAVRRASTTGYPREMTAANNMRRGSPGLSLPGIAPIIAPYYSTASAAGSASATTTTEKNPFVLPWAVRGMLSEDAVKKDPELSAEVRELVKEFEEWRPTSKGLRDLRWRLEGVRSLL